MIRQIFLVVAVVALAAGIWFGSARFLFKKQDEKNQEPIETSTVQHRPIEQIVRATGEVAAVQDTDIKSEVSGRIDKVNVKMGDKVKQGDVLLELYAEDLKSEHEATKLQLEAARIRREKIGLDYDRKKKLREQSFIMDKDLQEASIDLRLSENEIEINRARLQTVTEKLTKLMIRAPHDGTVLNVKARVGVVVSGAGSAGESTVLMQIADTSQLQVLSEINEVDVIKVSAGMTGAITFDSLPGVTVKGKVDTVSISAIPKDKDKSIRVFPLILTLEPSGEPIKPGITANVAISTASNEKALSILSSAVFLEGGSALVFVEKGGKFEKCPVQLGITDHVHVEIRKGLADGEQVALQRPPGFGEK